MTQVIIDRINGVEPDTSDQIMQCQACKGFYPVPYYWATLIRCRECSYLAVLLYNEKAPAKWRIGKYVGLLGY